MEENTPNLRILGCLPYGHFPRGWVVRVEVPGEKVQVLPSEVGKPYENPNAAIEAAQNRAEVLRRRFPEVWIWNKEAPGKVTIYA